MTGTSTGGLDCEGPVGGASTSTGTSVGTSGGDGGQSETRHLGVLIGCDTDTPPVVFRAVIFFLAMF